MNYVVRKINLIEKELRNIFYTHILDMKNTLQSSEFKYHVTQKIDAIENGTSPRVYLSIPILLHSHLESLKVVNFFSFFFLDLFSHIIFFIRSIFYVIYFYAIDLFLIRLGKCNQSDGNSAKTLKAKCYKSSLQQNPKNSPSLSLSSIKGSCF